MAEGEGRECQWCGEYFHWDCYTAHLLSANSDEPWVCRGGSLLRREPPGPSPDFYDLT